MRELKINTRGRSDRGRGKWETKGKNITPTHGGHHHIQLERSSP